MIRLVVVSSRIFVWPLQPEHMSGGRFSPASSLRTSFDASSSACPGATSAKSVDRELPVEPLQLLGPRPRSSCAMLSIRTGCRSPTAPSAGRSSAVSRRWFSSTRILTGYCSRPSGSSRFRRRRRPSAAACCRSSPSGRRDRRRAADRRRRGSPGFEMFSEIFGIGQAGQLAAPSPAP